MGEHVGMCVCVAVCSCVYMCWGVSELGCVCASLSALEEEEEGCTVRHICSEAQ